MMTGTTSVAAPLMERDVCPNCRHFHRAAIIRLCECCKRDVVQHDHHEAQPLGPRFIRCKTCGDPVKRTPDGYAHKEEEDHV